LETEYEETESSERESEDSLRPFLLLSEEDTEPLETESVETESENSLRPFLLLSEDIESSETESAAEKESEDSALSLELSLRVMDPRRILLLLSWIVAAFDPS
jgi:hypothetical protein